MTILYHYTSVEEMKEIYKRGMIVPGGRNKNGPAVYFTEMEPPPENSPEDIAENNNGDPDKTDRVRRWFKFDLDDLPKDTVKCRNVGSDRNIWKCQVSVRVQDLRRKRRTLYHYTDKAGRDGIYNTGIIKAVLPHGGKGLGASMPVAVYFTELPPDSPKEDLLFNMYGTRDTSNPDYIERTRYWFKFYEDELPNVRQRQTRLNRNEWVCDQDVKIKPGRKSGRIGPR